MATGKKGKLQSTQNTPERPRWRTTVLALTLVPIIAGVVLIATWALDISVVGSLENQVFIGLLFILVGFTLSNLVQAKWQLFAGWLLLTVADTLLLLAPSVPMKVIGIALAMSGVSLLAIEFYRQFQRQSQS